MSRSRYNADRCPHCACTYRAFRTGFTYQAVFELLMDYSEDTADWKYKRRGTILGKWHQMKRELWQRHIDVDCEQHPNNIAALAAE